MIARADLMNAAKHMYIKVGLQISLKGRVLMLEADIIEAD